MVLVLSMFVGSVKNIDLDPSLLKAILKNVNLEDQDIKRLIPIIDEIRRPDEPSSSLDSNEKGFSVSNTENVEYENLKKYDQSNDELRELQAKLAQLQAKVSSESSHSLGSEEDGRKENKEPENSQIKINKDGISVSVNSLSPELISKLYELAKKDKKQMYSTEVPQNIYSSSKQKDEAPSSYNSISHPHSTTNLSDQKSYFSDLIREKINNYKSPKYELRRDSNGKLVLADITDESKENYNSYKQDDVFVPKNLLEENPSTRQSLQISSLAQALYTPYSSDKNMIHLNLRGKDGKNGNSGPRGPPGLPGPEGMIGPKGKKGLSGTCENSVSGMYTCTDEEIAKISFQVDYLERICHKILPPVPLIPSGILGSESNPMSSCQALFDNDPDAKSGAYWLMINGIKFKTWCFISKMNDGKEDSDSIKIPRGGWTLVARIQGQTTEWSPISINWISEELLDEETSFDITSTTSMKNYAYSSLVASKLLVCYQGYDQACAPFTHNKNMSLMDLMNDEFGVVPDEQYTFSSLMKAFDKSCDVSALRESWCGINLANICDAHNQSPNDNPPRTTHIVRIGCIGDKTATCFPDDYAIGIGVTSCKDGFGCSNVGASKNLHYRCDYVYGYFSQTVYLYVN